MRKDIDPWRDLCTNAEPGTYGHHCGRPATWLGRKGGDGRWFGYCDECKEWGHEGRRNTEWRKHEEAQA